MVRKRKIKGRNRRKKIKGRSTCRNRKRDKRGTKERCN
jgi:hypothetical protein